MTQRLRNSLILHFNECLIGNLDNNINELRTNLSIFCHNAKYLKHNSHQTTTSAFYSISRLFREIENLVKTVNFVWRASLWGLIDCSQRSLQFYWLPLSSRTPNILFSMKMFEHVLNENEVRMGNIVSLSGAVCCAIISSIRL